MGISSVGAAIALAAGSLVFSLLGFWRHRRRRDNNNNNNNYYRY